MEVFIIVEKYDIGTHDTVERLLIATNSVYGGSQFPFFNTKKEAEQFIKNRKDSFYRRFEVLKFTLFKKMVPMPVRMY